MRLHAFIIGWSGWENSCESIAAMVFPHVEKLTVVYSNSGEVEYEGVGEAVRVPNDWFYGRKFEECLRRFDGDVMLQIHADAFLDRAGWARLIERCRYSFGKYESLGVWAPEINYTPWDFDLVEISDTDDECLKSVAQTDGVVWALSNKVLERLKFIEFEQNNLGWGVDWISIAYSFSNNLLVLRDVSVCVDHPRGSGYLGKQAVAQMNIFLKQMSAQEKTQYALLNEIIETRRVKRWLENRSIKQRVFSRISKTIQK